MDENFFIIMVVVFIVSGGIAAYRWYFSKDARTRRKLKSRGRIAIAEVQDGAEVKIGGRVSYVKDPLIAPLSGRECACWEVVIEEHRGNNNSSEWRQLIREQDSQPFYIEDETGRALVDAAYPQMALDQDARYRSGTFTDATPELEEFLNSRGHSSEGFLGFNKKMRYREGVLEEGEVVAAFGRGRWEPDPEGAGGYRENAMRLILSEPDESELLISDTSSTID